jgi:hypothetical protein
LILGAGVVIAGIGSVSLGVARLAVGGTLLAAAGQTANIVWQLAFHGGMAYKNRRVLGEVPSDDGKRWLVRGRYAQTLRLIPASGDGWAIEVGCEAGSVRRRAVVEGAAARHLAARIVPAFSPDGGRKEDVLRAVRKIEEQRDPESYLRWLARNPRVAKDWSRRKDVVTGKRIPPGTRLETNWHGRETALAVEMAVNEENERHALESELTLLEEAWKDAEEVAAIADGLALPTSVERGLLVLQGKRSEKT